jgi:hypothetical protein
VKTPQIVAELRRIAKRHRGLLRPSDVVLAARPLSSPLHSQFEWDDTVAAQRYRIWQARQLISVSVELLGTGDQARLAKVFVSLTPDRSGDGGGYRSILAVFRDRNQRAQLLADALEEMERFQEKYRSLKELLEVFDAMNRVKAKRSAVA